MKNATMLLFFMMIYPHASFAETFQSSEFLTWDQEAKEFYIRTSVGMAGLIAGQNDRTHADCIDDWYYDDQEESNAFILDMMAQHSEFHPRGVILAVLEAQCGEFDYINRQS